MKKWIEEQLAIAGRYFISTLEFSGFTVILLLKTLYYTKNFIQKRHEIARQMFNAGVRTFPVLSIVALFTGMVLSLQLGIEMKYYGQEKYLGQAVIATLTREMGPFTAAIILIASVGAAMAAEVGTMKVSEEIDALEIMSISPVKFLVMPRVIALALVMPIATVYINFMGVLGAAVVANSHVNVSFDVFYFYTIQGMHFKAVYVGLLKSFVFGMCISSISCAHGLKADNGAIGVGHATRDSVVASFITVLIVGYYITEIFFRHGL
ncbi:MAG: ABC transporter permease [Spirochaetae bacterium HGW-Spirochaetae-1]|jgi:phospholipid/cholesterol/gamma-HCH transport system permease protein|nr:MAG: ABC transporter permease [Spirochaetae bacterium HGW-Spirochaetae-1]